MTAFPTGIRRSLAVTLLAICGTAFTAIEVQAQQVFVTNASMGSPMGGSGGNRVTSKSIAAYSRLLGMDQDQSEIAGELHRQYVADVDEANQRRRAAIQSLMAEFRESEDHSILREEMPKLAAEADERSKSIEASLFDDLRLLLDEDQAGRWESVERLRRRETTLRRGSLSGETTNLISITEKIVGEDSISAEIAEQLERYEMELDRALIAKAKTNEEVREAYSGMTMTFDMSMMEEVGKKTREAGVRVREVNKRHARAIASLLSEDLAAEFSEETKRNNFPQVYRESRVDQLLGAAQKLSDLGADQKSSVDELGISYNRERSAADSKWAAAITKDDEEGGSGFSTGSMTLRIIMEDSEDESPVAEARKDRKELDKRFEDRLLAVLNPDQRERMPEPSNEQSFGRGGFLPTGGSSVIIDRSPDRD